MGTAVTIRGMSEVDLRGVFLLGEEVFGADPNGTWNADSLAALLGHCMECSLVALRGRRIAGFVITEAGPESSARVRWMAWRPGDEIAVASPLIEALMQLLFSRQISSLQVTVDLNNPQLIEIFKKYGFTESKQLLMMEHFFPSD